MKNEKIKEITSKADNRVPTCRDAQRRSQRNSNHYLTAMAKFHRYSLRNIMLIATQMPTVSRVAQSSQTGSWRAV
jgi:hypothetical protein